MLLVIALVLVGALVMATIIGVAELGRRHVLGQQLDDGFRHA